MLALGKTQKYETHLMIATLVDWNKKSLVEKLEKQLKKAVKKHVKLANVSANRINTFMVLTVDLKETPSLEDRKKTETSIKEALANYSEVLNKIYRKEIVYNGDSDIYYDAFKSEDLDLKKTFYNRKHGLIDDIEEQIETIISTASLILWDSTGYNEDRIILPDIVAIVDNLDELSKEQQVNIPEIADLIDELIITNFAGYFLPFAAESLKHANVGLDKLLLVLEGDQDYGKLRVDTERALRNFIGSISGLQESLKLLKRIVLKLQNVLSEIEEELLLYPSTALHKWLLDLQKIDIKMIINSIEVLDKKIYDVKPVLRLLLKAENEPTGAIAELFNPIIEIKAVSSALIQYTNQFADIPSFTTMIDGIAFESVENEVYEKSHPDAILETSKLFKMYRRGGSTVYALRGIDLAINEGDFAIIQGSSGSGKTTLLNMLAGLDSPDRGAVYFNETDLNELKDRKKSKLRRENFSFIFQSYALIQHLDAFENVKLPIDMGGLSKDLVKNIQSLLDNVGIGEYADHKPGQLSGGQMQRLGIARALANRPSIIFADEPTGDLDEKTGRTVMELLKKYHEETGVTIILVTHDPKIATYGTKHIRVEDGQIVTQQG